MSDTFRRKKSGATINDGVSASGSSSRTLTPVFVGSNPTTPVNNCITLCFDFKLIPNIDVMQPYVPVTQLVE